MKYFITTSKTYFVDPHGTPDEGGVTIGTMTLNVSENEEDEEGFNALLNGVEYVYNEYDGSGWQEADEDNRMHFRSSEDGYNSETETHTQCEVTEEEYNQAKSSITNYSFLIGKYS